jgi:hypothetical protein
VLTTKRLRYIFGRRDGFLIIASLAALLSSAGCSSAPLTDSSNSSSNMFADLFGSSRKPADPIAQPPDFSSSGAGQSVSSQPHPLPPSRTGPQTTSAGDSLPGSLTPARAIPPGGAINVPVVSGAPAPPPEQSPATNADILRSAYQSLKEGDECQSPTDYCYNTQK